MSTLASFHSLPSELRNTIYELVLLQSEPIIPWVRSPWSDYSTQPDLTTAIFRACKAVYVEASSLFYGQNCFDFANGTSEEVASFLDKIGAHNANCIRHIIIDFPDFQNLYPGDVALDGTSVSIGTEIQSNCHNLCTITTSLYSTNAMEYRLDGLENLNVAIEALRLVDSQFRALPSLEEIVLEVFDDGPSDYLRTRMKSFGWILNINMNIMDSEEENWHDRFSDADFDDFDDDYYDDDDMDDDYDIDNDSDFWRRAAD